MSRNLRSLIVALVGGAAVIFAADRLGTLSVLMSRDFIQYWSAGRVNLRGENPYDPDRLLAEQREADPGRAEALMMWNPPPALAVYMPLGVLPPRAAALPWLGLQLLSVLLACDLLWRAYAPGSPRWVAPLAGLTCVGTWWVLAYGQNTGLLVLGLAGFLHLTLKGRPSAAGACAALTALKPHLLAGFGVLVVADALSRRGRAGLAAGAGVIGVSLGVALLANPAVAEQYLDATHHPKPGAVPLRAWELPVFAYWLRMQIDPFAFWVQFVPCGVACVGLVAWRVRAGSAWDWRRALPAVVAVSVLVTPYGGWIFDLPVLLVPVVWCAARLASGKRWRLLGVFLAGQATVNVVSFTIPGELQTYWWVAPSVIALCATALGKRSGDAPGTRPR